MKPRVLLARLSESSLLETRNRIVFTSIDSTNEVGKTIIRNVLRAGDGLPSGILVALEQTEGRGRLGRRWVSPQGGIYVSCMWPQEGGDDLPMLPIRIAVALCNAIDSLIDTTCRLKWPNDLIVAGRKIGGILIETVTSKDTVAAVVGFGVNYRGSLSSAMSGATSVSEEMVTPLPYDEVVLRLIEAVEDERVRPRDDAAVVAEYVEQSVHRVGQYIRFQTGGRVSEGTFLGFDESGFLRLHTRSGEQCHSSGDILEAGMELNHES